jgi:hypothetical protein
MKNTLFLILTCFNLSGFAQLFLGDKNNTYHYVELKGDSAHLEIFKDQLYSLIKIHDEVLTKSQDSTMPYGSSNKVIKQKNKYYLLYKPSTSNDVTKIELKPCLKDIRESLRKEAYFCQKNQELSQLQDSLAGPAQRSTYSLTRNTDTIPSKEYIRITDQLMDSLSKEVIASADKTAQSFYKDMDSIYNMKQNEIFNLLNKAKYEYHYGRSLVYTTATVRPEILISFIEKNNTNKLIVLRTIRDHKYLKGIITKVKAYPVDTYGKAEILKQNRKRNVRESAGRAAFAGLILAEIALIAGLIVVALR